jgi:hypothetical protein
LTVLRASHHKTATTAFYGLIYAKKLQTAKPTKPKRLYKWATASIGVGVAPNLSSARRAGL